MCLIVAINMENWRNVLKWLYILRQLVGGWLLLNNITDVCTQLDSRVHFSVSLNELDSTVHSLHVLRKSEYFE